MRGRFVGKDCGSSAIAGDDALLLAAACVTRAVFHSFAEIGLDQQVLGTLSAAARDTPAARSGPSRSPGRHSRPG